MQQPSVPLHIGIAGAGPAGLATAIALSRQGHRIEVFEKHPTLEPLGAGLLIQPQGLRAIDALGVRREFDRVSVPIQRLLGTSHRGWRIVDIDLAASPARAISRSALSGVLYQAAQAAGVQFSLGCEIQSVAAIDGRARALTNRGDASFDLFAIADGAASRLREHVDLAGPSKAYPWGALWGQFWVQTWEHPNALLQRCRGTSEMMGLLPTEVAGSAVRLSFFWSLRADRYLDWKSGDLSAWRSHVLSLWPEAEPLVRQIQRHDDLSFAVYRHTWARAMGRGPFCVVGDSAHAMSPQLGLGTTLAMQDALALAEAVKRHGASSAMADYSARRLRASQAFQTFSRVLTPCFQAKGGGLWRDALFGTALHVPGVPWMMRRSLAAPSSPSPSTASMYERAMGDSFGRLPPAVRRFHSLVGLQELHGWVDIDAPSSWLAGLLARCLGTPRRATSGPIRFELDAAPETETWTRYFPTQKMKSRLRLDVREIVEHLGAARLTFDLCEAGGRLQMRLLGLRFLGIPCPRRLLPRIIAEETGQGDRFHFRVQASLPVIGTVASYRGHLKLAQEAVR